MRSCSSLITRVSLILHDLIHDVLDLHRQEHSLSVWENHFSWFLAALWTHIRLANNPSTSKHSDNKQLSSSLTKNSPSRTLNSGFLIIKMIVKKHFLPWQTMENSHSLSTSSPVLHNHSVLPSTQWRCMEYKSLTGTNLPLAKPRGDIFIYWDISFKGSYIAVKSFYIHFQDVSMWSSKLKYIAKSCWEHASSRHCMIDDLTCWHQMFCSWIPVVIIFVVTIFNKKGALHFYHYNMKSKY